MTDGATWVLRGIILVAGLAVYANSINGAFVFDDIAEIVDRSEQLSDPWPDLITGERRPVVALTLALAAAAAAAIGIRGVEAFVVGALVAMSSTALVEG